MLDSFFKEMVYVSGICRLLVRLNWDQYLAFPYSDIESLYIIKLFTFEQFYQNLKNQNYLYLLKKLERFPLTLDYAFTVDFNVARDQLKA